MEEARRASWTAAVGATRPTKAGAHVLYVAGLFLAVALATGRTPLYAGAALLLSLYLVGHVGAAYAWRSLSIDWDCPPRVFAATPFAVQVRFRNRGRAHLTGIRVPGETPPTLHWRDAPFGIAVLPGATASVDLGAVVRHRGRRRLGLPRIEVRWPFGLAVAAFERIGDREVLAYPRRVPVPARAVRSRSLESSRPETAAAVPRGGELLRGLRDWASGDSPRGIAWRASARHGTLLSREFEREDAGRAIVALDLDVRGLSATDRAAAVERACSLAASLLLRLRAEGRSAALAAWTPEPLFLGSVAGERGLGRALEELALISAPARREDRRDPLDLVPASCLRGARVVLVKAGRGPERTRRLPGGGEVVTVPSLHATFQPEAGR
jgi:uncharacterized protein (DUF58 family)